MMFRAQPVRVDREKTTCLRMLVWSNQSSSHHRKLIQGVCAGIQSWRKRSRKKARKKPYGKVQSVHNLISMDPGWRRRAERRLDGYEKAVRKNWQQLSSNRGISVLTMMQKHPF